ncbi:MAG TPA: 23S rRNA (guanosine(2251)-2'-O)-methyltransferase RlmB [Chloroflexota bacterium]|nr:23S rRNA (guanosine(2251)-2'-O)-methyltransferase RlmB [Chloroflexota bacterium]
MAELLAGRNAVAEALRAHRRVQRIFVEAGVRDSEPAIREALRAAETVGIPIVRVPRTRLDSIHPRHQGIAAELDEFAYAEVADVLQRAKAAGSNALVLALDQVQDPQNVGSLLRTALAVGVTAVVIPSHRAAGISPAVVRASAGAVEHLAVCQAPNLARALRQLKEVGLWIVGLDAHGPSVYDEVDLSGPVAVVVGAEGSGLRRLVREECDFVVRLPMAEPVESLNVAVAGSILLYHLFRRRATSAGSRA